MASTIRFCQFLAAFSLSSGNQITRAIKSYPWKSRAEFIFGGNKSRLASAYIGLVLSAESIISSGGIGEFLSHQKWPSQAQPWKEVNWRTSLHDAYLGAFFPLSSCRYISYHRIAQWRAFNSRGLNAVLFTIAQIWENSLLHLHSPSLFFSFLILFFHYFFIKNDILPLIRWLRSNALCIQCFLSISISNCIDLAAKTLSGWVENCRRGIEATVATRSEAWCSTHIHDPTTNSCWPTNCRVNVSYAEWTTRDRRPASTSNQPSSDWLIPTAHRTNALTRPWLHNSPALRTRHWCFAPK